MSQALFAFGWQGLVLLIWLALSIGSFLNVVIYRVPVMLDRDWKNQARDILGIDTGATAAPEAAGGGGQDEHRKDEHREDEHQEQAFNLVVPRSRCPSCGHQITALENIPLISWVVLKGKCSSCASPISIRYPAIELLTAVCTVAVISIYGFTWLGLSVAAFTWMLIALTFIDYDTTFLPDQITYPLLWLGLLTNFFYPNGIVPLESAVIGAVAGYLFLWATYWGFKLGTGKEGMGYGDFKLFAALGAWLGWNALPGIILIAAATGLIYAIVRIVKKSQSSSEPIPFGPFLAIAGWVTLIFRDEVLGIFVP